MPTISFYTPGDGQVHTLLDKVANSAGNIVALWRVTILNSAYDLDGNSVTPALVLVGDDVPVFPLEQSASLTMDTMNLARVSYRDTLGTKSFLAIQYGLSADYITPLQR